MSSSSSPSTILRRTIVALLVVVVVASSIALLTAAYQAYMRRIDRIQEASRGHSRISSIDFTEKLSKSASPSPRSRTRSHQRTPSTTALMSSCDSSPETVELPQPSKQSSMTTVVGEPPNFSDTLVVKKRSDNLPPLFSSSPDAVHFGAPDDRSPVMRYISRLPFFGRQQQRKETTVPEIRITFPDDEDDDDEIYASSITSRDSDSSTISDDSVSTLSSESSILSASRPKKKPRVVVVQISESGAAFVRDLVEDQDSQSDPVESKWQNIDLNGVDYSIQRS
ncbi:uncharacterized protein V1516DRAFT_668507 [Lipomyces oligophaga]|uniref:uncharacterized protein n=1 Tax=Lipomyces oligophaga TaxID=45792 RepID=UPI0034CF3A7C